MCALSLRSGVRRSGWGWSNFRAAAAVPSGRCLGRAWGPGLGVQWSLWVGQCGNRAIKRTCLSPVLACELPEADAPPHGFLTSVAPVAGGPGRLGELQ